MEYQTFTYHLGGTELRVESGRLASQADGSALVTLGETTVLVTAVMKDEPEEGQDFLPLFVDFEERFYAAGKIKGSRFIKREGKPSEESVLTGRLVDRTIRPFFPEGLRNQVQIVITVLSADGVNDPDVPALLGASVALLTSDIPWHGPVAGIRVGKVRDRLVLNPSYDQREEGKLDLFVGLSRQGRMIMLDGSANFLPNAEVAEGIGAASSLLKELNSFQDTIGSEVAPEPREVPLVTDTEEDTAIRERLEGRLDRLIFGTKTETQAAHKALKAEILEEVEVDKDRLEAILDEEAEKRYKERVLEDGARPDGRDVHEVRSLSGEIDILPRTHGASIFTRGQTQSLSIVTLGAPGESQIIDEMEEEYKKRFMHHYNFPPFSVGEVKPMRAPSRREIGHGALAEKALDPLIPSVEEFPYTIRVVSEILESNGSSSMASVCSSSMAMMRAGVPIKEPAAGIAIGIVEDEASNYQLLTDIQGPEDKYGEMDLKIAGTRSGITALQMDVKGKGLTPHMFQEALMNAKDARHDILDVLDNVISGARSNVSEHAPKISMLTIDQEKIGDVIGPGGKTINKLISETGVKIDIEDDGQVYVTAESPESAQEAIERVKSLTKEIEVGEEFDGEVVNTTDFGAFVEVMPDKVGLLHISELSSEHVDKVEDVVDNGDRVRVKVKKVSEDGKFDLTLQS
jgi:polyribonucleotide nucleotidyltransferase